MMLPWINGALWVGVISILLPSITLGFEFGSAIGTRSEMLWTRSTRIEMSSGIVAEKDVVESTVDLANGNDDDADDPSNSDRKEVPTLLNPASRPSQTFAAPNLDVTYQPIYSDGIGGESLLELLPLQKYHARNEKRRRPKRKRKNSNHDRNNIERNDNLISRSNSIIKHDVPSLDLIYENQSRFQITKSSQVLLEEYHDHKQHCIDLKTAQSENNTNDSNLEAQLQHLELLEGRLRSKLRAECRASLPLSIQDTLQILYCDAHICVVNKPSGVLSVPGHRRNPSLAELVYDTVEPSSCSTRDDGSIDDIDQSVVHRLDMATSGIIVYALSKEALQKLHVTFRDRKVQKIYQALVEGHLLCGAMEGEIDVALERDPTNPPYMRTAQAREEPQYETVDNDSDKGQKSNQHKFWREAPKTSKTTWSILSYEYDREGKPLTRLALKPHTGRTHQLRVHTSRVLGTPIVGDDIYGSGAHDPNANLCLHAHKLCIHHPITGAPMVFEADPPF